MYRHKKYFDFSYKKFIGSWAWILHRLSGLALIFYLSLHIWVINHLTRGEEKFNALMNFLNSPLFKFLEVGLWGVVLFHAFNGARVVAVDLFHGSRYQKQIFWVLILIAVLLWIGGSYIILAHLQTAGGSESAVAGG